MGGNRVGGDLAAGFFVEPTIWSTSTTRQQSRRPRSSARSCAFIFLDDEDEAIELANGTPYGLAVYVQSKDIDRIHRMTERLRSGGVYANGDMMPASLPHRPFGWLGLSGYGKEGGRAGIDAFLRYKTVAIIEPQ